MTRANHDLEALHEAARAHVAGEGGATAEQRHALFAWALAYHLGECCRDCGGDTREHPCHCEDDT